MPNLFPALLLATGASLFTEGQWLTLPPQPDPLVDLPLVRREFETKEKPKKATLRIVALGDYEPFINGKKISATGMNQAWSAYEKTLYVREFDVTPWVKKGRNCLGLMLTNSFWHNPYPPKGRYVKDGPQRAADHHFLLRAELAWEDGAGGIGRMSSNDSWRTSPGPVSFSHVFGGEDFDARKRVKGWAEPGFDDSAWKKLAVVEPPKAQLALQDWPSVAHKDSFKPSLVRKAKSGAWFYEFPQNSSAQLRLKVKGGKSGDKIAFRCGEHKHPDGKVLGAFVVNTNVTTDGSAFETQWSSFYLGMQFVEVEGAVPAGEPNPNNLPVIESMELVHVRADVPEPGRFSSSSSLYNDTARINNWAIRSNMMHALTDCPHREKLGWLECAYLLAPTIHYGFAADSWFSKLARDVKEAQFPDGRVPTVAPNYPAGNFGGPFNTTVEWGAAAVLLPWHRYEWSGNGDHLRDSFLSMKGYTDWITNSAVDGVAPGGLGDWYDYGHGFAPGPSRYTDPRLSATATWAMCATATAKAADVLGQKSLAKRYRDLHAKISKDFQRHFRDPQTGLLRHSESPQTAYSMALMADLVAKEDRPKLLAGIIADLEKRGYQQTAGDIGHVYLIRVLAEAGRSDVLHKVYSRTGKGSYGGILAKGLTTMPETWDAIMDGDQSLNHCMLGHVMEWFYGYVAGIRQAKGSIGWKQIEFKPEIGSLTHASANVETPLGRASVSWKIEGGRFKLEAVVPKGARATAVLPSGAKKELGEGKHRLSEPAFMP